MEDSKPIYILLLLIIVIIGAFLFFQNREKYNLPEGETKKVENTEEYIKDEYSESEENKEAMKEKITSTREKFITDGVTHSIPLSEILSGGPGKDGIPSIDEPKFITANEADDVLTKESPGLGLVINGDARFYPYRVMVWHEIVNDTVGGEDVVVTYCPLCATGVVYDRTVDGEVREFGVSGMLWQSNLLMYDRTGDVETESLWSQVLGEAVLGPATGKRLKIVSSDTIRYGDWKEKYPETRVLSEDTGALRRYGTDPYGDYYVDNVAVGFGVVHRDGRLENKDFVLGVEVNGEYKAYRAIDLPEGTTVDEFAHKEITIEKSDVGEVRMFINGEPLQYIGGFWFSWVAVHPDTEVYKN